LRDSRKSTKRSGLQFGSLEGTSRCPNACQIWMISIDVVLGAPSLTQLNGVLTEKLTGAELGKKLPAFYRT